MPYLNYLFLFFFFFFFLPLLSYKVSQVSVVTLRDVILLVYLRNPIVMTNSVNSDLINLFYCVCQGTFS